MPTVLLHVHFPHAGPWSDALHEAYAAFADSLCDEPGLLWKLWLEHPATGRAGGSYLFSGREHAEAYLARHRERLAQWGVKDLEVSLLDVNDALSRRTGATPVLPAPAATEARQAPAASKASDASGSPGRPERPFTTWAEVAIADFDQFLRVFSTAGREARRGHGSLRAQVFRVPGDPHAARVLIDWRDRRSFEAFVDDPQVRATMRSGGALRPPVFSVVEAVETFDA